MTDGRNNLNVPDCAWPEPRPGNAEMVQSQLVRPRRWSASAITDRRVLEAFRHVDRAWFVPGRAAAEAYADNPLPIGEGQTISQPWIVAYQLELLRLDGTERVLEIGTGCGYVTALLAMLAHEVWSIERLEPLATSARERLHGMLHCRNVHLLCGDGTLGWPDGAPFDAITVAAASPGIPGPLVAQLAVGGRLCLPVEDASTPGQQHITVVTRTGADPRDLQVERHIACRFVKLYGAAGWQ